jgi:diacylglycerol kinase
MALVYTLEILNTVVEALVDMYTREYHPLAKVAKDAAAGAVLVAAIFAVGVAVVIFVPRVLHWLFKI